MSDLADLRDVDDPAIELLRGWVAEATRPVTVLPPGPRAPDVLVALQVTRRSTLGALAHDTGGILVDGGWLRLLGGGSPALRRDLAAWNRIGGPAPRVPGALVIADDALGGFFAIDGGGLGLVPGHVAYFAPDSLAWEDLDVGHSAWVHWVLTGDLDGFYGDDRWPGWQEEIAPLTTDQALAVQPPLWAAGEPIAARSRRGVPIEELWGLHVVERWGLRGRREPPEA